MAVKRSNRAQHPNGLACYFRANSITIKYCDF